MRKRMESGGEMLPAAGLSQVQAQNRLEEFGENVLTGGKKIKASHIFAAQFKDVMVMILLVSTVLSVLMGEVTEAITIIVIVLLNALLGFFQEFRTEKTLDKLKNMAAPGATVLRDGVPVMIPASQVVRDDVVLLKAGDRVPADAVILEASSLYSDESLLSGESVEVEKIPCTDLSLPPELHRSDMVYMGTVITKGRGRAMVVSTGMQSEMGHIAGMLSEIEPEPTPLQKKLDVMGKYIAIGCLVICAVVAATGILRGEPVFDMVVTGISLAVAAVPEGLPAIVTIALALSVSRMLKRNALVRKLHAVETLGCADVICSDKTGTLTENKMTATHLYTTEGMIEVTGSGYEKGGEFLMGGRRVNVTAMTDVQMLLHIAVGCNNASIYTDDPREPRNRSFNPSRDVWQTAGEATETALLILAAKAGVFKEDEEREYRRIDEIPFDSTRKCMSVIVSSRSGDTQLFCKGAPDVVLEKCGYYSTNGRTLPLTSAMKQEFLRQNEEMGRQALRVLGFAYKTCRGSDRAEQNLVFCGLTGMIDPPRQEAYDAVLRCRQAGIRPVMITGDHIITASAIARKLKILTGDGIAMTGAEIDGMDDREFERIVGRVSVFARVTPGHKLRIVRALKKNGHVVAMTGDGVNDAPAIKEADIGVAMGMNGTDVTKEASSIILMDDNFATLVAAVEQGRVIYDNIRKFIRYLLSSNIGEVLTMFIGMLMGMPVILLPIQILLINLVTDGLPAIALGLEGAQENVMRRKPRSAREGIFAGGLLGLIIFRGCLIALATLGCFVTFFNLTGNLAIARTGAFLTLVLAQLIHVFECKSEQKSLFRINIFDNWKLIFAVLISAAIVFLSIYHPWGQFIFRTIPLSFMQLMIVSAFCIAGPLISSIIYSFSFRKKEEFVVTAEMPE
ncbi:cation-translocating P-type ATPase [Zongyangia hominis]|uniref:Cation-translocating P-type ATPase n=1 Tax=Zongyangia hominis TaxID=2763677 RepID=A0A926EAH0_9FIRM|nr:cation-translocating P-type ATPase [Zongyangia hominis]MBC8569410.1 cation-translocating P-type ATPase [Zongyangia hominis]